MSHADELAKARRVRAGHRGSATKTMNQLDAKLRASPSDLVKVSQLMRSLEEKVVTLKDLDAG